MLVTSVRLHIEMVRSKCECKKAVTTRVERSVFQTVAFPVWLLAHMAGEAGFEPTTTVSLVTSVRLRGVKNGCITRVERSVFCQFR